MSIILTTRQDGNGDTVTMWAVGRYGVQCECGSRGGYVETVTFGAGAGCEWACGTCGTGNVETLSDAQAREVAQAQPWADSRA